MQLTIKCRFSKIDYFALYLLNVSSFGLGAPKGNTLEMKSIQAPLALAKCLRKVHTVKVRYHLKIGIGAIASWHRIGTLQV